MKHPASSVERIADLWLRLFEITQECRYKTDIELQPLNITPINTSFTGDRSCEMITFQSSQSSQISPPFNKNWLATIVFQSWDTWGWLQPESLRLTAPPPEELDQWVTGLNINMITASLAGSLMSSPWLCYTAPSSRSLWAFNCRGQYSGESQVIPPYSIIWWWSNSTWPKYQAKIDEKGLLRPSVSLNRDL